MTVQELADIICAEASVLDFHGKWAVGQCVRDNGYNAKAFAPGVHTDDRDTLEAAQNVLEGLVPYPDYEVIKLRSKAYSKGNFEPDWDKLGKGPDPFTPDEYQFIDEDHTNDGKWCAMYFGRFKGPRTAYTVQAGVFYCLSNAEALKGDLEALGYEAIIKEVKL